MAGSFPSTIEEKKIWKRDFKNALGPFHPLPW